ncbi:HNH nuclease [Vibrio phage 2.275.O._10N.286.54.E11]|nr:HNH nuclease [Vibrio phage 2.275.O._10N.286.54.E11]
MQTHEEQYNNLIKIATSRDWTKDSAPCYVENHHIIPKSMGGTDDAENMVYLTAREHYMAHYHLAKWHRTPGMAHALFMMTNDPNNNRTLTEDEYVAGREAISGVNNPFYGKKHTKETKKILSEKAKGRKLSAEHIQAIKDANTGENNYFYGKKHTEETKAVMSEKATARANTKEHKERMSKLHKGKTMSDEACNKISEANKGENNSMFGQTHSEDAKQKIRDAIAAQPQVTCPHCEKQGKKGAMQRWHFDRCRNKPKDA